MFDQLSGQPLAQRHIKLTITPWQPRRRKWSALPFPHPHPKPSQSLIFCRLNSSFRKPSHHFLNTGSVTIAFCEHHGLNKQTLSVHFPLWLSPSYTILISTRGPFPKGQRGSPQITTPRQAWGHGLRHIHFI